jgi:putative PIN family toxin of toxin-antitoxin system
VVLDTNSVLSALVFPNGRLAALREAWQQARCEPLVSKATVEELVRVLTYPKFRLDAEQQRELLGDYVSYATVVRMPAKAPRTPVCRDPSDVPFLELALAGSADFLVTGDRDLLALAARFVNPIITPAQFLKALEP